MKYTWKGAIEVFEFDYIMNIQFGLDYEYSICQFQDLLRSQSQS